MASDDFNIWTLYDHPSDYPDCYVARRFSGMTGLASDETIIGQSPAEILRKIEAIDPNVCEFIQRSPNADPVILGTWI